MRDKAQCQMFAESSPSRSELPAIMFDSLKRSVPIPQGAVARTLSGDDWQIDLDLTPQMLSLEIPETPILRDVDQKLAPTYLDLKRRPFHTGFVSASMLALKAKLFDDSLYAAVECALQPAKAKLLQRLLNVAPVIAAAARLGGIDVEDSPEVATIVAKFLSDERHSKPIGFYTWNEQLRRIFHQDRLLQQELEKPDIEKLLNALNADSESKAAYVAHLEFISRFTNPHETTTPPLFKPGGAWFFPASSSHEAELASRLFGDRPVPDGFSLADEMVKRVRDGSLQLSPRESSGWYDWQTWALEPLIAIRRMPESAKLKFDGEYLRQLENLFKATLAMTRETHVKQLFEPMCGSAMSGSWITTVHIAPELTVEPTRSYYERRAQSYDFVRSVLESVVPIRSTRGITASGESERTLEEDLTDITALFRGAADVVGRELGIKESNSSDAERFRKWARHPGLRGDIRMMVPVFFDIQRRQNKVWAILGWDSLPLKIKFSRTPRVYIRKGWPNVRWEAAYESIAYPVFAELYVSRLLDRDEFRAHCDRYGTVKEILAHLQ